MLNLCSCLSLRFRMSALLASLVCSLAIVAPTIRGAHAQSSAAYQELNLGATGDATLFPPTEVRKVDPFDAQLTIAPDGAPGPVTYMRFDTGTIPLNARIKAAVLQLTFAGPAPKSIILHVCLRAWHETQLKHKTAPLLGQDSLELNATGPNADGATCYSSLALPTLVGQWLGRERPNYGFAISLPSGSDLKETSFSSKEDPTASKRPVLSVIYLEAAAGAEAGKPTLDVPWKNDPQDAVVWTLNVRKFGAIGDGRVDDSDAFTAALAAAVKAGGGIVYAPAGHYRFEHNVNIPAGISLRGDWVSPQEGGLGKGTIFEIAVGRGQIDGDPFMNIGFAGGIRDITFYYPDQNARAIVPYPYTLSTCFSGFLRHLTFVNSYRAVCQGYGVGSGGNLIAEHIYGTPLNVGLYLNVESDYSSVASVRFSPVYWPAYASAIGKHDPGLAAAVEKWTYGHASGVMMGYVDTVLWCGTVVDGYRRGMCFAPFASGVWTGGKLSKSICDRTNVIGQFYDVRLLNCAEALCGDDVQETGVVFSNCQFDGDIAASLSTTSSVVFDQCRFHGKSVGLKCISPASRVSVLSSTFAGSAPVRFDAGRVALTNDVFEANTPHTLTLGKDVDAVVLVGCQFACLPGYTDESLNAVVRNKPLDMPLWPATPSGTIPMRVPRSTRVIDASLAPYNTASDGVADASPALQKALNALGGKGGTVFLPAGQYRLGEPLSVPAGVELRGTGDVMARPAGGYISPVDITGTALMVDNGQGSEAGPAAISLGERSGVRGVTIVYLARRVPGELIPFPPAILGQGGRCYVMNTDLIDPHVGIEMRNVSDFLIKDIVTGSDHLGVRIVGGSGGAIENYEAHGQILSAVVPPSWRMPKWPADNPIAQLQKTATALEIENAIGLLVQNCGEFAVQNGFVVRGGSVTFRVLSCDSVKVDGMRLEGTARVLTLGYQHLTSGPGGKAVTTTSNFTGEALFSGNVMRNLWLDCQGTGRVELRGVAIEWVRSKIHADAGSILARACLSDIDTLQIGPDATFRAESNIDQRGALQSSPAPNCKYALNAPVVKK